MLKHLTILDFALVAKLDVAFGRGLTVVTGESGAGKSLLMSALALVLGERANTGLIRPGASRAEVTAEFDLSGNSQALGFLAAQELNDQDHPERCLSRRVIGRDGRSRAFINGAPVNLQLMRTLTERLVDIHGQDENQRLAQRDVQLDLLDAYGVASADRRNMGRAHQAWRRTEKALAKLQGGFNNADGQASLLRYQLDELRALNLVEGEFESMQREFQRLSQAQDIQATVAQAIDSLAGIQEIRQAQRQVAAIEDDHASLADAQETLACVLQLADDAAHDLRRYIEAFDMDPAHLAQLSERLDSIHSLAHKHRIRPERLVEQVKRLEQELDALASSRDALESLQAQAKERQAKFERIAALVSEQRRRTAEDFAAEVSACIKTLGLKGGALHVHFEDAHSERGLETLEFHVTTNPRHPAGRLGKIASGGERARISLAICMVAAQKAQLPCLVLDEADVGVGGATADTIGRLLRDLGQRTQVICVTHAPQAAALGNAHLVVEKDTAQDVQLHYVSAKTRVEEVARMLAGADVTDRGRAYARTLLEEAGEGTIKP